jgi:hypothetical protein
MEAMLPCESQPTPIHDESQGFADALAVSQVSKACVGSEVMDFLKSFRACSVVADIVAESSRFRLWRLGAVGMDAMALPTISSDSTCISACISPALLAVAPPTAIGKLSLLIGKLILLPFVAIAQRPEIMHMISITECLLLYNRH